MGGAFRVANGEIEMSGLGLVDCHPCQASSQAKQSPHLNFLKSQLLSTPSAPYTLALVTVFTCTRAHRSACVQRHCAPFLPAGACMQATHGAAFNRLRAGSAGMLPLRMHGQRTALGGYMGTASQGAALRLDLP